MFGYALTEEQIDDLFEGPPPPNTAPVGVADSYTTARAIPSRSRHRASWPTTPTPRATR